MWAAGGAGMTVRRRAAGTVVRAAGMVVGPAVAQVAGMVAVAAGTVVARVVAQAVAGMAVAGMVAVMGIDPVRTDMALLAAR